MAKGLKKPTLPTPFSVQVRAIELMNFILGSDAPENPWRNLLSFSKAVISADTFH